MIEVVRERFDESIGRMKGIEDAAAAEGRDELTEPEQATWDELRAQADTFSERLGILAGREELDQKTAATMVRIARPNVTSQGLAAAVEPAYASPGGYAMDYMRMQKGDHQARARLTRALLDVTTAETPGLVPPQVIGSVIGTWMASRPSVSSFARPQLPAVGMEVQRPHITQHVDVQPQAVEKTQVASRQFKLDLLKADLKTWAGAVDVSWQLIERSSPAAIDLIFSDFVAVYARNSNMAAAAAMAAAVTQTAEWDGTAGTLMAALMAASAEASRNSVDNLFPDTIWLGLNSWVALGSLADEGGRPLFPFIAPQNALGGVDLRGNMTSIGGMQTVVDPFIDPDTFIVGDSTAVEFYETDGAPVRLSVVDVGVLGYNIGVAGMFATLVTDPGSFVKFSIVPPVGPADARSQRASK
jgi:HK97 family phage major capsid protein